MSWDDLISAVNWPKAKAHIYGNYHLDQRCPRGNRSIHITRGNQGNATRDSRDEPIASVEATQEKTSPKSKLSYPNISHSETNMPHKMSRRQRKEQRQLEDGRGTGAPITQDSTARNSRSAPIFDRVGKDLSQIICYKCDKSGYFANKCTEPKASSSEK